VFTIFGRSEAPVAFLAVSRIRPDSELTDAEFDLKAPYISEPVLLQVSRLLDPSLLLASFAVMAVAALVTSFEFVLLSCKQALLRRCRRSQRTCCLHGLSGIRGPKPSLKTILHALRCTMDGHSLGLTEFFGIRVPPRKHVEIGCAPGPSDDSLDTIHLSQVILHQSATRHVMPGVSMR
jgi:hypothetical protein